MWSNIDLCHYNYNAYVNKLYLSYLILNNIIYNLKNYRNKNKINYKKIHRKYTPRTDHSDPLAWCYLYIGQCRDDTWLVGVIIMVGPVVVVTGGGQWVVNLLD